ncbi:MAG: hypothetical protein IJV39_03995 [Ruminococcus sp.]|nr:hypothetical protein [Ruminococcus sp.]
MNTPGDNNGLLISRISDLYYLALERNKPVFSKFLNEQEISVCLNALKDFGISDYKFFGGYNGSQRAVLGFFAENEDFPITPVEFTYRRQDVLNHSQFLGTILSTGLERAVIGDIICQQGKTYVFVLSNHCDYIISRVDKVARVGVKSKKADLSGFTYSLKFKEVDYTVSSLRLDNIVAAITGLSREKTRVLILSGVVFKNQIQTDNVSAKVEAGDTFSIRKYGKFILSEIGTLTKKGRIKIRVKQFI